MMQLYNNKDFLFSKKGVFASLGMSTFLIFNCVYSIADFLPAIMLTAFFLTAFAILFLFKIANANPEKKEYYLFYGFLGTSLAFLFAVFAAWYHSGIFFHKAIIFIIILCVLLIIFFLIEIISKRKKDSKDKAKTNIYFVLAVIAAVIGLSFSDYLRRIGKEISLEMIFICGSILFSIFYGFIIKYRKENNQSEDDSVIDD